MITATDIFELTATNMQYIGPALLVLSALAVADQLAEFAIRIVRKTSREYRP